MAAVIFRTFLEDVLLMADEDMRDACNEQGLNTFADFLGLEAADITQIASNIRKPGGLVQDVNHPGQVMVNPGMEIGHVFTRRLEMLRYYVNHCARVNRLPIVVGDVTLARLHDVYELSEIEKEKKDPELPDKIVKIDDIRVNIEQMDEYLAQALGHSFLPLLYVVRDAVEPPVVDEGFGMPTYNEEMVMRGDHGRAAFQRDNTEVWNVIHHMTHGGSAWNWVQGYARTRNGREAYIALKSHYLGDSYQARIRAAADATLHKTYYDGTRTFTFESYISTLQKAFMDLESTGEMVAEERKVRTLLRGIIAANLQPAVQTVQVNQHLKTNYQAAVNYLAESNDTLKSSAAAKRNISSMKAYTKKKQTPKTKQPGYKKKVNTEYMSSKEWYKLSDAQRAEIRQKRSAANTSGQTSTTNNRAPQQRVQTVVTGTTTDVSSDASTPTATNQSVGAVMTRRNRNNN